MIHNTDNLIFETLGRQINRCGHTRLQRMRFRNQTYTFIVSQITLPEKWANWGPICYKDIISIGIRTMNVVDAITTVLSLWWKSYTRKGQSLSWWRHQMKHFPRYWPFVRGIHLSPVNSPHKGQWRGALMFSLICVWINGSVNTREAGD